jgi:hypothetical protein
VTRRGAADLFAAGAAVVVLGVGLVTVVLDSHVLAPESTTTVMKDAVSGTAGTTKTTETTTTSKRGSSSATTKVVVTTGPAPEKPAEKTTTVEAGDRTFSERVLGDGGVVVLQIAAVLLAAFIAAAAVQRVILGEFGFKFGTFELAGVADESAAGIASLNQKVDAMHAETTSELKSLDDARRNDSADLKDDLALAYKRMALIEDRLADR